MRIHVCIKNKQSSWRALDFESNKVSLPEIKHALCDLLSVETRDTKLVLSNAQTGEEYRDDRFCFSSPVALNVRVLKMGSAVKRVAAVVASGSPTVPVEAEKPVFTNALPKTYSEEELLKQLVASASQYRKRVACVASKDNERRVGNPKKSRGSGIPPAGYLCRRCRLPGHFISHCPAIRDPSLVAPEPPRPAMGIPRTFLCSISQQEAETAALTEEEEQRRSGGTVKLTTQAGQDAFFIAKPNSRAFRQFFQRYPEQLQQNDT